MPKREMKTISKEASAWWFRAAFVNNDFLKIVYFENIPIHSHKTADYWSNDLVERDKVESEGLTLPNKKRANGEKNKAE